MTNEQAYVVLENCASLLDSGTRFFTEDHTKQFREAYELAMKALRKTERKTGKWIPCSERLPEPNRHDALNVDVYYLAQTEFGDMIVASYNESHEGTKWWEQMYSYRIFDDEIVAWMPLPEPWEEARTNESNNRF